MVCDLTLVGNLLALHITISGPEIQDYVEEEDEIGEVVESEDPGLDELWLAGVTSKQRLNGITKRLQSTRQTISTSHKIRLRLSRLQRKRGTEVTHTY